MEDVASEMKAHPMLIVSAIGIVAVLAYLARGNSSQAVTFAGGGAAPGIDPNAAAIEEAAIQAGQAGVQSIAQLLATENTNSAELQGSLAQTQANVAISEANDSASVAATQITSDAATKIAGYNAATEAQRTAAQQQVSSQSISSQQAVARAHDNTTIVESVLGNLGNIVKVVGTIFGGGSGPSGFSGGGSSFGGTFL